MTGKCKCDKLFCNMHRSSDAHECLFDYQKENQGRLSQSLPKMEETKVMKIA